MPAAREVHGHLGARDVRVCAVALPVRRFGVVDGIVEPVAVAGGRGSLEARGPVGRHGHTDGVGTACGERAADPHFAVTPCLHDELVRAGRERRPAVEVRA